MHCKHRSSFTHHLILLVLHFFTSYENSYLTGELHKHTYPNTYQLYLCVVGKLSKRASGNPAVRPLMHMRVTYVELYMLHWCVCVCVYVMLGVLPVCIPSYEYMCVYVCSHWAQCAYENMCICVCEINIFYIKGWLAWWRIMLNVWLCVR